MFNSLEKHSGFDLKYIFYPRYIDVIVIVVKKVSSKNLSMETNHKKHV